MLLSMLAGTWWAAELGRRKVVAAARIRLGDDQGVAPRCRLAAASGPKSRRPPPLRS